MPSQPADDSPYSQELFQGLRSALRTEEPLDLLMSVSVLMAATDPRGRNPFQTDETPQVSLEELVDSFVGVDYAETTAALSVIRALTPDDLLSARIGKVLAGRRQPMPPWLRDLGTPTIGRVGEMKHVLGDGDNYLLEARLPSGEMITALVYVDHNMGTVVKDAFCTVDSLEALQQFFRENADDPDTAFDDADPAQVRSMVDEAIKLGAMTFPPLESETWPGCRPLVEWLLRSLPAGGAAARGDEWSDASLATLRHDFLASPYGSGIDEDEQGLLEDLTWFGSGWAGRDPLRWSPVNVELLLVDWIPRKIVADAAYLTKAPAVLRRFIEYCHNRRGIRHVLTIDTLAAVDRWEPEYQRLIRSSRPDGASALGELMLDAQRRAADDPFGGP